eukprot:1612891-Rhodomonas_salina.1
MAMMMLGHKKERNEEEDSEEEQQQEQERADKLVEANAEPTGLAKAVDLKLQALFVEVSRTQLESCGVWLVSMQFCVSLRLGFFYHHPAGVRTCAFVCVRVRARLTCAFPL